jgi:hypothetical protein
VPEKYIFREIQLFLDKTLQCNSWLLGTKFRNVFHRISEITQNKSKEFRTNLARIKKKFRRNLEEK